jgi:hypothetical protein
MFTTVTYKSISWLKNNTKEGGAMNEVLSKIQEDNMAFNIISKKHGRMWGSCDTTKALKLIQKNSGANEILHKFPMKVYFDIDKTDDLKPNDLTTYKNIILKHFPDATMAISGSETDKKHSYHITLTNYIFKNEQEREQFKLFVKTVLFIEDNGFDSAVYTKNRNMKCVNQSKPDCPRIQQIIEDDDIKNHLITAFIGADCKSVQLPENIINLTEQKSKEKRKVNIMSLPKMDLGDIRKTDLTRDDLYDPINLLNLLPINKDFDHTYTWMVARFCYNNELTFDEFYNWYKEKNHSQTHYEKWKHHWSVLGDHPPVHKAHIMLVLEKYYPGIRQEKGVNDFVQLCDISEYPCTEIENLSQMEFYHKNKALIVNIGMGGGKTTQTVNYLKEMTQLPDSTNSFIWMTPNIALAENTFTRMKDFTNTNLYNTVKRKELKQAMIETSENLMVCMNSLKYVTKKYNIVVIDEMETFLKKWCFNSTLDGVQSTCYNNFIRVLKEADQVIILDAFITRITLDFLRDIDIKFTLVKRKNDKSYNNRDAIKYAQMNNMIQDAVVQLKQDKKLFIFYPYCKGNNQNFSMTEFQKILEEKTGKKGISHNSETSDNTKNKLKNVNTEWEKYDFVVSNNVITVGVNFDIDHFDQVYLFIAPFNEMRDIVQFSYRPRKITDNVIKFCYIGQKFNWDKLDKNCVIKSKEYKNLRDNIMVEQSTPNKECFNQFLFMAGYNITPDEVEISKRELETLTIIRSSENYYDYDSIEEIHPDVLRDAENEFYSNNCSFETKLMLRKYHYDKRFKSDATNETKAEIWNGNYIKLVDDVKKLLTGSDKLMDCLKNEYKWELHFPENINDFKFDKDMLKQIFESGFCSRKLNEDSKHRLILKSYMNCYFDEQVITSKVDKSRNVKFNINEKFKKIYIMIKDSVYLPVDVYNETVEFTDDNTYGICSKHILEEKNDINNPTEEEDDNIDINNSILSTEIEDPLGLDYGLH